MKKDPLYVPDWCTGRTSVKDTSHTFKKLPMFTSYTQFFGIFPVFDALLLYSLKIWSILVNLVG